MLGFQLCARIVLVLICPLVFAATSEQSAGPETAVLWQPGDPGERLFLRGRVVGPDGQGLAGAIVYIRQADGTGMYHEDRFRARLETTGNGMFSIATVLPGQYMGAKHIHVAATHDNYPALEARIVFKGDPNLNQTRAYDLPILLEEVHQDGDKVLVGDVELVLGGSPTE